MYVYIYVYHVYIYIYLQLPDIIPISYCNISSYCLFYSIPFLLHDIPYISISYPHIIGFLNHGYTSHDICSY